MDTVAELIRTELKKNADPERKKGGERFFREEVNMYGVRASMLHQMAKKHFSNLEVKTKQIVFGHCEELFRTGIMEESLIACLWAFRVNRQYMPEDFKTFDKWINRYITNWATCDTLCNHPVGTLVEMYPELISGLRKWAGSENRWVKRASAVSLIIPARKGKFLKEIFEIGTGTLHGDKQAAIKAYDQMGEILGDAVASVVTLIDGLVVIGGGLAGASPLFMDRMIAEMNNSYTSLSGEKVNRLASKVYNLENEKARDLFLKGSEKEINIPGNLGVLKYDPIARVGVGISKIGTSKAISLGAYAYALKQLDRN